MANIAAAAATPAAATAAASVAVVAEIAAADAAAAVVLSLYPLSPHSLAPQQAARLVSRGFAVQAVVLLYTAAQGRAGRHLKPQKAEAAEPARRRLNSSST